jgi:hypothetical protein
MRDLTLQPLAVRIGQVNQAMAHIPAQCLPSALLALLRTLPMKATTSLGVVMSRSMSLPRVPCRKTHTVTTTSSLQTL